MSTASEEILGRYKKTFSKVDKFGRTIVIGPIRPAAELAVLRLIDTNDRTNQITYLAVASVRKIDEFVVSPPRSLADLETIYNQLDREGIEALGELYAEMKKDENPQHGDNANGDGKAEVKNA